MMHASLLLSDLQPPNTIKTDTQNLTVGAANARISCEVEYGNVVPNIAMCYAPNGESFGELNVTEDCFFCGAQQENGYCESFDSRIRARPDWKVTVSVQNAQTCNKRHVTVLEIPKVDEGDEGVVYCSWSYSLTNTHVYEQYKLRVQQPPPTWIKKNWKYMAIGGGLFVSVVLVVVLLLVVGFVHSWRKARRAEAKAQRRRFERKKLRKSVSPPLPRPEHTGMSLYHPSYFCITHSLNLSLSISLSLSLSLSLCGCNFHKNIRTRI